MDDDSKQLQYINYSFLHYTGGGIDFLVLNRNLTLTATSNGSRGCFGIAIIDDAILEDTEFFLVSLMNSGDMVVVTNPFATVILVDNDGKCEVCCMMIHR